ncbi:truC [Symbiodinium necroappetens]|uniref:TruC protein n=1 Tax=Symbiodinium necroappetens TaxID=1628268 RepID=A0A812MSL1_9DINO|nr:truC [Symbiodinium necroappetens]
MQRCSEESENRSTIACNSAISACEKAKQWQCALDLLWQMPEGGNVWDEVAFSAATSACGKAGRWSEALALLGAMVEVRIPTSIEALSAAVTVCEDMSEWQQALQLFASKSEDVVADEILLNAVIAALAEGGKWQMALSVLLDFEQRRLHKTEVTYTAAICSCGAEQWPWALALFAEEIENGLLSAACPNGLQAGTVLSMLHKAEGRSKAASFAEQLRLIWHGHVQPPQPQPVSSPSFDVLARGCGVLVVEKPNGLESAAVLDSLRTDLGIPMSSISRLDQPTSGILPIALGDEAAPATQWLRAQWAGRLVAKSYVCLCAGPAMEHGFSAELALSLRQKPGEARSQEVCSDCSGGGRPARTIYTVLASYSDPENRSDSRGKATSLNLLKVRILTGRKHQIRVHLASIGQPLVGDKLYRPGCEVDWCPRMFLHCRRLDFLDLEGRRILVKSRLPAELAVATYDQFKSIYSGFGIKGNSNVVASSFTAGLVYSVITMPFESAKNRMASQKPDPETGKLPYRGTMQTIQAVAGKEGAAALYNGFMPYCLRCGGHTVLMFFAVEELQKWYRKVA